MSKHAFGTTFKWNNAVIAGLTAINGIELTVDVIDVTTHDSPDAFKEKIPGMIDAGEVSLEGFFDPDDTLGQQAMLADCNSRQIRECVIQFPESTKASWTFQGFITRIKIGDAPIDGVIPFSASIMPAGKPVFTITTT